MAGLTVARINKADTANGNAGEQAPVKLTPLATAAALPVVIASFVAIAGAVQPFFTGSLEDRLKRAIEEVKVESAQREAASEWMKVALAIEDAAERGKAVRFMAKAGLLPGIDPSLKEITDDEVPKMPRPAAVKPADPAADPAPSTGKAPPTKGG